MSNAILLKLIKFGIGFILFIPLYIGGSFFFPFIFPKIWLFQLVTEIIFFLYIVLALKDARFRPKWNWAIGAVALLSIILIITSLTGIDAFRSFWGNTERMSGVIAWFHFVAFAVVLAGVLRVEKEWQNFLGLAVAVSILEFFYALAQHLNAAWVWIPSSRAGTIGNADLLGSYAIFSAFFALYLWRNSLKPGLKWFWATAFFLNIATLYIASSRGAIIGFILGLAGYVFFSVAARRDLWKKWAIGAVILLAIGGLFWTMRNTGFVKNNVQLDRLANASLQSDTVRQRFTEWGIAWNAFKARPIFGFGPNNYLYLHNVFLDPRVYELRETNFDRAHNAYLDYASMSGILGLAGYLVLIAVLFWIFLKNKSWVFSSAVIAYAAQSFFVFDSPASYISLFLLIGFAIYNGKQSVALEQKIAKTFNPQTVIALSLAAGFLLAYVFWQVSVKQASANLAFTRAFTGFSAGTVAPQAAFENYKQALKYTTLGTTEFRNQYTQWLQRALNSFSAEERLTVIDFGISELENEVREHPLVFSYLNLGQLYYFKASGISDVELKSVFYKKTMDAYDEAIKLAPKRLELYYSYLQLAVSIKDYDLGLRMIKKTTEIAPNYPKNWWYAGIANIFAGKNDDGIRNINKALSMYYAPNVKIVNDGLDLEYDLNYVISTGLTTGMPPKQEILGVVSAYIDQKKYKELLLLYLGALKEGANDVDIHKSLALIYHNLGFGDKANEELKIVEILEKGH